MLIRLRKKVIAIFFIGKINLIRKIYCGRDGANLRLILSISGTVSGVK